MYCSSLSGSRSELQSTTSLRLAAATSWMPATISEKYESETSWMMTPTTPVEAPRRAWAWAFLTCPSSRTTRVTCSRVAAATG